MGWPHFHHNLPEITDPTPPLLGISIQTIIKAKDESILTNLHPPWMRHGNGDRNSVFKAAIRGGDQCVIRRVGGFATFSAGPFRNHGAASAIAGRPPF